MVSCKHCSTPNSLDSTFCKRCGTALPDSDVQAAQEKLTALIAEGNTSFNEGKTDEAMAVAESALLSNPSSVAALSLKALCHERRGELALALECADQIVDLNPDSELDRIRRNQLRTKLSVSVQLATQPPDRRTALIGAVATVILVLCIGIGAARLLNRTDAQKPVVANTPRETSPTVANQSLSSPTNGGNVSQPVQTPVQQPNVRRDMNQTGDMTGDAQSLRNPRLAPSGSGLPETDLSQQDPIVLEGPLGAAKTASPTPTSTANSVKVPSPVSTNQAPTSEDPAPTPDQHGASTQEASPGIVDIQISSGVRKSFGGSVDTGGGAMAFDKVGIQRFQLGSYGSAASSFEQALRSGGDQISVNQWLGRCYDKLGRTSDEIEAYKRCVSACQAAISKGSGNKDRIHAIMDTCQQELKVLQGN